MTTFDEVMTLVPVGEHRWTAELTSDWQQGRTIFGGLLGALATKAAEEVAGPERPVRSLDLAFLAPVSPGKVEVTAQVLGAGRSVSQVGVTILQDGVPKATVHVVAGASRPSALFVSAPAGRTPGAPLEGAEGVAGHVVDPATEGIEFSYVEGLTPRFTQHVQARWVGDNFLFTGAGPDAAHLQGWCRLRHPTGGLPSVVALLDAWPAPVLPMATGATPASTVRWSAHVLAPVPAEPDDEWWWYESETVHAADGYVTARAGLYLAGRLVVWSEQLVVVYDSPNNGSPGTGSPSTAG